MPRLIRADSPARCAACASRSKSRATACLTSACTRRATCTSTTTTRTRTLRLRLGRRSRRRWATARASTASATSRRRWTRRWYTWCWCAPRGRAAGCAALTRGWCGAGPVGAAAPVVRRGVPHGARGQLRHAAGACCDACPRRVAWRAGSHARRSTGGALLHVAQQHLRHDAAHPQGACCAASGACA